MRSIEEVKDNGDDTLTILIRSSQGIQTKEVLRIDDFALIQLIGVAMKLAERR
jgi:hypothetical protein